MAEASHGASLRPDLFDLIYERSKLYPKWGRYDPWDDLAQRPGVDIVWHLPGQAGTKRFPRAIGLTTFADLRISLKVGMPEHQLRSVLTHELMHVDRGPLERTGDKVADARAEDREEERVELAGAQRLIDPVLFDAVMTAYDGKPGRFQYRIAFQVDDRMFKTYRAWRRRVKPETAIRRWEEGRQPIAWPPPWLERRADRWPDRYGPALDIVAACAHG